MWVYRNGLKDSRQVWVLCPCVFSGDKGMHCELDPKTL